MSKRVLVTGASHGLGRALAHALAMRGHRLVLAARNADELAGCADEIRRSVGSERVAHLAVDLRQTQSIAEFAQTAKSIYDGLDVLINNAGIGAFRPFLDNSTQELADLIALNLEAPMHLTHALLPGMLARAEGDIINIASDLARRPLAQMAPYVASKHGLLGFGASLHRELRGRGVRVTTVMPGIIDSRFNNSIEGSRDPRWALPTSDLARQIAALLELPRTMVVDEFVVHPAEGDY